MPNLTAAERERRLTALTEGTRRVGYASVASLTEALRRDGYSVIGAGAAR